MDVNVTGHQFWWEFSYPDTSVVTANELHLPVGQTVNLVLQSDDVIHSFWVPALGGKRDAFPGHTNYIWMKADSTGEFPGQCYQLCGYSHGNMRERAIIQSPADFQAWVTAQQAARASRRRTPRRPKARQVFQTRAAPRVTRSTARPRRARSGPNLTHIASRGVIAGAILENNAAGPPHAGWQIRPRSSRARSCPTSGSNDHELDVLVAYLQSLQVRPPRTVLGRQARVWR